MESDSSDHEEGAPNMLAFMFGNVNERGQLEDDDEDGDGGVDVELKRSLVASSAVLSRFLSGSMTSMIADDDNQGESSSSARKGKNKLNDGKILAAKDAVDFADMDELIPDADEGRASQFAKSPFKAKEVPVIEKHVPVIEKVSVKAAPVEPAKKERTVTEKAPVARPKHPINKMIDSFKPDSVLTFTDLVLPPLRSAETAVKSKAALRRENHINTSLQSIKQALPANDEKELFNSDVVLDDLVKRAKAVVGDELSFVGLVRVAEQQLQEQQEKTRVDVDVDLDEYHAKDEEQVDGVIDTAGSRLLAKIESASLHPLALVDWEAEIVWDGAADSEHDSDDMDEDTVTPPQIATADFHIPDYDLIEGDWTEKIIWDDPASNEYHQYGDNDITKTLPPPVEIPLNDPNLIIDIVHPEGPKKTTTKPKAISTKTRTLIAGLSNINQNAPHEFNISNDRYYEIYKLHGRHRNLQRSNVARSFVEHSLPALRLELPFFRRYISKQDLRCFHRPPLRLLSGEAMKFTRIKNLKNRKKLYKGQSLSDILQTPEDITLRDNSSYVLFEYSEEYPPMLSNVGMSSHIINYYRKKEEKDPYIPKLPVGIPQVLEQVDASPFYCFGSIPPGETMQAIKNNLFISPIWQHKLPNDDFLLIRFIPKPKKSKKDGQLVEQKMSYFIREIPRVFTVGQLFAVSPVHPPSSRNVKFFVRDRLKALALRRIKARGRHAKYPVHHIVNSFHHYHDQSLRKHMRGFAEVIRGPNNTQFLKLLPNIPIPSEQEIQKICTPEMACAFEALRVGQQRLADVGYGSKSLYDGGDDDSTDHEDEDAQLDDEIQLAPWHTTGQCILAAQNKGMVQIYGPGDPTGRGEGYSFFRFSMKEMFLRAGASRSEIEAYFQSQTKTGHKFSIQDQQKMYQDELKRVWAAQKAALSSDADLELDQEEIAASAAMKAAENASGEHGINAEEERELREVLRLFGDEASNSSGMPSTQPKQHDLDSQSVISLSSRNNTAVKKALVIRRLIKGTWHEEVITDPRVITPYLNQKKLIELTQSTKYAIKIEDDEETRKKKISELLRLMKRESGISRADLIKMAQASREGGVTEEIVPSKKISMSQRKCRSCGQLGHISTNRICPDYAKNYPKKAIKDAANNIKIHQGKLVIATTSLQKLAEKEAKWSSAKTSSTSLAAEATTASVAINQGETITASAANTQSETISAPVANTQVTAVPAASTKSFKIRISHSASTSSSVPPVAEPPQQVEPDTNATNPVAEEEIPPKVGVKRPLESSDIEENV